MTVEASGWSDAEKGHEPKCRWPLATGRGKERNSLLRSPEGRYPCLHHDFRLPTNRTIREEIRVALSHKCMGICSSRDRKRTP